MKYVLKCLLWVSIAGCFVAVTPPLNQGVDIYWIDTEGGAATLVVTPSGESVLFDTGNPGERDAGRIHQVATEVAGLEQIDHLVITHFHIDHFGGAADLAKKMPIINLYDKGVPATLPEDTAFATRIAPYKAMAVKKRKTLRPNDAFTFKSPQKAIPPLVVRCLGFDKKFIAPPKNASKNSVCGQVADKETDPTDNANSAAFLLSFGNFSFFDGGDMTWNIEKNLVCPVNRVGTVDVYQVNHHGLDQSNHPALVKTLAPTVAVMNNGKQKGCGPQTMATLKSTPSIQSVYLLHKSLNENVQNSVPDSYCANVEADSTGNYIKLTVDPNGSSYTVSIPATGQHQSFRTKRYQ